MLLVFQLDEFASSKYIAEAIGIDLSASAACMPMLISFTVKTNEDYHRVKHCRMLLYNLTQMCKASLLNI